MLTIFRCVTDGSTAHGGTPLQQPLYEMYGPMFAFVYYVVYLGVTIGLFNLIMSIFIQTVLKSGTTRWQQQLGEDKSRMQHRIGGYFTRRSVESRFPVSNEGKMIGHPELFNKVPSYTRFVGRGPFSSCGSA